MTDRVIIGLDYVRKEVDKIIEAVQDAPLRRRILIRGTLELADRARAYPPAGPWNSAPGTKGNNRWYQRLYGSRYMRKDGSIGGRNSSQQLQKNWHTQVSSAEETFTGHVFTDVTYAPYLLDPSRRVSWAAGHGWKTTTEIADGYKDRFIDMALEEIDKALDDTKEG